MIKLVGIVVVAVGFGLRLNTLVFVMAAGLVTGLAAGPSGNEIMERSGRHFLKNRHLTLSGKLMLPVVGLLECHGMLSGRGGALTVPMTANSTPFPFSRSSCGRSTL